MVEFYLPIRHVHIAAVLTSATLLLARGLALNLAGARWPLAWPLRYLSWTIDTVLLTAALMLMTITHQDPVRHGWLTVKVLLLVPYIVLGYMALRGARRLPRWPGRRSSSATYTPSPGRTTRSAGSPEHSAGRSSSERARTALGRGERRH